MTASIKPNEIARAMHRASKHKALVPKWHSKTVDDSRRELEDIVRADHMAMTDKEFRAKYANFIGPRN